MEQNNEAPKKKISKSSLIGFIVSVVIESLICGLTIIIATGSNNMTFEKDGLLIMLDATSIPGGLFLLFYLIMVCSNYGAFDALSYAVKLVWYNTFHKEVRKTKLAPTYRDYRVEKNHTENRSFLFMVYAAIPFVVAAIAIAIPYYITR